VGFPHRQPYYLLCYLLLNRQHSHLREQLAAIFWNEHPTLIARKHLRNALWRLRGALEEIGAPPESYLSFSGDSVSLTGEGCWLDVEAFETTTTRYRDLAGQDLAGDQAAALADAVSLYSGDLLEGIYDDWCLYDRERLRLLYLSALGKLMSYHGIHGSYEQALACGQRILLSDNTREKVHRQMMQLYWLAGQRDRALAQYKLCVQILRDTLGIAPLGDTRRLHQQMVRGQCDPTTWPAFRPTVRGAEPLAEEVFRSLAEDTLTRLRRLEDTLEQTRLELQSIERLVYEAMVAAGREPPSTASGHPPSSGL
jgi:DNA-binding SARP family transcriptional activator